jgi:hypothetical protein
VILTHPFEYVHWIDRPAVKLRRHRLNQRRLTRLCEYLGRNSDRFSTCGMAAAASMPLHAGSSRNLLLEGGLRTAVPRMIEQAAYDKYGMWRLNSQSGTAVTESDIAIDIR